MFVFCISVETLTLFSILTARQYYSWVRLSKQVSQVICHPSRVAAANEFVRSWPLCNTWFLGPTGVSPKQHIHRFKRFCTAHPFDRHADRHTYTQTTLRATSL